MSVLALSRAFTFSHVAKTSVVAASQKLNKIPVVAMHLDDDHHGEVHIPIPEKINPLTPNSLSKLLGGNIAKASIRTGQVRYAHTDMQFPDFSEYRTKYSMNPVQNTKDNYDDRFTYSYVSTAGVSLMTAYAAKGIVHIIVKYLAPSEAELALASIEVKLGEIPVGKNLTVKWRGKPLFIRHRTAEDIEREKAVDLASLRDPQSDADRAKNPEWLVLIGICTHLGCVPIANAGDFNGYFCPCHGSHYDGAGRIRKGPAPLNLEIPPYEFTDPETLLVG